MPQMKKILKVIPWLAILPATALAHEAYVLPHSLFVSEINSAVSWHAFDALKDPGNLKLCIVIILGTLLALIASFWCSRLGLVRAFVNKIERLSRFGPWLVRVAISASFFFSALTNSFLGPEISLGTMPLGSIVRILLFGISIMILFGLFTELAAIAALLVFGLAAYEYHWYLATYLNYIGEILVLILFGTHWSLDRLLFGWKRRFQTLRRYETDIVRICYGAALAYAAINVKLLHPSLTLEVVNRYNLTQFHWLFPHDPLLITLGAGLSELAIGLFILLGFRLRLTVLISLFYITLSLLYFKEAVWPHFLLYGISFNLLITPQQWSLDNYLERRL